MVKKLHSVTAIALTAALSFPGITFAGSDFKNKTEVEFNKLNRSVQLNSKLELNKKLELTIGKKYEPINEKYESLRESADRNNKTGKVYIKDNSDNYEEENGNIIPVETEVSYKVLTLADIQDTNELYQWYNMNSRNYGISFKTIGDETYVLVAAGEKPTGGYSVKIESVTMVAPGNVYIAARVSAPSPDMMVIQAFTYPHVLIKLETKDVKNVQGDISGGTKNNADKDIVSAKDVRSIELFTLMEEKIKNYNRKEFEKIVSYYNNSEIVDAPMIMMITGNTMVINLKEGGKIRFTSYGSETNVVANVQIKDGESATYHLVCPEIAKILLSTPEESEAINSRKMISKKDIESVELYTLEDEKIKEFDEHEINKIVKSYNKAKETDELMIAMITGNTMVINLKEGGKIRFTSYGSETNVVANVQIKEGEGVTYHLICPEIAKILLKDVNANGIEAK
mgnify:CR=1 FL=1